MTIWRLTYLLAVDDLKAEHVTPMIWLPASATAQVAALSDTYLVAIVLIAIALALAVWGLIQEWRGVTGPAVQPEIPA